jgi:F0F1-type ATP synthase assembly protein I
VSKIGGRPNSRQDKNQSSFLQRAGLYLGVAFELPGTIFGGLVIGYFLDEYFRTSPWLLISLGLAAFAGAFVRLLQWARFFSAKRDADNRKENHTAH